MNNNWATDDKRAAMDQILDGFRRLGVRAERYGDGVFIGVRLFSPDGKPPGDLCIAYAEEPHGFAESYLLVFARKEYVDMNYPDPWAKVSVELERVQSDVNQPLGPTSPPG